MVKKYFSLSSPNSARRQRTVLRGYTQGLGEVVKNLASADPLSLAATSEREADSVFLRPFRNIFLLEFYLYALTHSKFLLSPNEMSPLRST